MIALAGNDLNIKVDATVTGFESQIMRAQRATLQYDASLGRLAKSIADLEKELDDEVSAALKRQHDAMDKTGKAAMVFGGAVVAGFAMATNEAVKWESAWTGVTKTVNGSAQQMDVLEGQLRQLAKTLPSSHEEIAAVAEAAGQLGVQRENIAAFTKTMIDLGQTTNLSADEAATSIAQFMNVMQTAPDQVDRVGSALVYLGNKGASTEADIMHLAQRLSGAGHLIGASEADVLALASSMANLGIQAELGGGAASRVLLRLYQTVKGGGDKLEELGRMAGMTGEQFGTLFGKDPMHALDAFIQGMGRVKDSGGDLIGKLGALGITGTQNLQVMLRLAGAGDMLTTSLDQSATAWDKNNALLIEANQRYQTTESKIAIARNTMRDAAIDVGGTFLPALSSLANVVADLTQAWSDLPGPLRATLTVLGLVAGAVTFLGGSALVAIPKIAAFKTAVTELEAGSLKTAGTKLMGLGSFLAGPWGIALAGGIAALGLFAAKQGEAAREVEALKSTLDAQTGAITENTREWVVKKLLDDGVLEDARALGISLQLVTDATLNGGPAMQQFSTQLAMLRAASAGDNGAAAHLNNLGGKVDDVAAKVRDAKSDFNLTSAALKGTGTAAKGAAAAQKGTTGAWQDGADAAGQLSGEVKTLGNELSDLSESYLNQRDAGRQVRSSLRDIRDAIRQYRKDHGDLDGAFKHGTKSGDEFSGMLDQLAKNYQTQIDTTERLTGSEKRVQSVYDDSRKKLIEVAQQLGMTKQQARAYADQVLGIPSDVKTHFATDIGPAMSALQKYAASLHNLDGDVAQTFIDVITRHRDVRLSAPNRSGVDSGEGAANRPHANGAMYFADGGFGADGRYYQRVPQIVPGGANITWGEKETGWEAYISGKPGMEGRNRDIWLQAGRRLGTVGALEQMFAARTSFAHHGGRGGGAAAQVVVVREKAPLIGQLTVPAMPGSTQADAHRVVSAVVYEMDLAQRSGRWGQ